GDERRQLSSRSKPKTPEIPRDLPRCFASRNAKRYTKQRGSLLWTTGTTRNTACDITSSDAFLLRPVVYFYSGVDTISRGILNHR
ncbi:MAG: hypothetical protein QF732_11780, partial [Nitrospinaceae bacterium]|nr:hypothetical protein [Nitrospinaceae bacterium]